MSYVYVLKSEKTGRRYVGSCRDLVDRLHRHSTGQSKATKYGRPFAVSRSFRTLRRFFFVVISQILISSSVLAQGDGAQSGRRDFDGILIAQAAVSNSTMSPEQVAPQILPPLPQSAAPLPSPMPKIPALEELDQMFKQSSLGKAADEARLRQQCRELSNKTINDSDLIAARSFAESAPTDLLKRQRLRAYYTMFYDRMRAKAQTPELKSYIDARKGQHLGALAQNKVRPSPSPSR